MIGAPNSNQLVRRLGTKRVVAAGLLITGTTLTIASFLEVTTAYWAIGIGMAAIGFGMGNVAPPSMEAVLGAVPEANAGAGAAVNNTTQMVGGALGIAILGTALNTGYTSAMTEQVAALPGPAAEVAKNSVGGAMQVASQIGGPVGQSLQAAGFTGICRRYGRGPSHRGRHSGGGHSLRAPVYAGARGIQRSRTGGASLGFVGGMSTKQPIRGRPRNPDTDREILTRALRLLAEQGYSGMSMEAVAGAAGVGKATLYRRYKDKRQLVIAALSTIVKEAPPLPDTGTVRHDLVATATETLRYFHSIDASYNMNMFFIIAALLSQAQQNPEFLGIFREQVIVPRRAAVKQLLERGVERGQIRTKLDLDSIVDCLAGSIFARHVSGQPVDERWIRSVIDLLMDGMAS